MPQGTLFDGIESTPVRRPKFLRPFFSFFGGKWRSTPYYPRPRFPRIVEPFAGSAGYSLRYYRRDVVLYEIDPVIAGLWAYLIRVRPEEILALPETIQCVDDVRGPQEARSLVGFWLNKGCGQPRRTRTVWGQGYGQENMAVFWGSPVRERIARQVELIRHWKVVNASYEQAPNDEITWFIDPPYTGPPGRNYRYHEINFTSLSQWCRSRSGQVIVCEQQGAEWLPFQPIGTFKAMEGCKGKKLSKEAIWTND